tara:strand:- start:1427 stop:1693 length:267 start_codon:yes stop_codon:yes gene_type:complete
MKNVILEQIAKNRVNYCHALEVSTVYELEEIVSQLFEEFRTNFDDEQILEFFNTLSIYYLVGDDEQEDEQEEEKIYNFNFENFIKELV